MRAVIVGGGTAGMLSALVLRKYGLDVVIFTDGDIIGVGESTISDFAVTLEKLDIPENIVLKACDGTIKSGIVFNNWLHSGSCYTHPFWEGKHGYHLNSYKLGQLLKEYAVDRGVKIYNDRVINVDADSGVITKLITHTGEYEGDLYIDCTGFKRQLISALNCNYISYHKSLRTNTAAIVQKTCANNQPIYDTRANALKYGWMWTIPLTNRVTYGYAFDSTLISNDEAIRELRMASSCYEGDVKFVKYASGRLEQQLIGNCVAIGLSSGFLEPIESTGISLITGVLGYLKSYIYSGDAGEFNKNAVSLYDNTKLFVYLHYALTRRDDSAFWQRYSKHPISNELVQCIYSSPHTNSFFNEQSYRCIIKGMGRDLSNPHLLSTV